MELAELQASLFFRKVKKDSWNTIAMTAVDTLLCVAAFFMLTHLELLLWSSLVMSFFIGLVCVVRFNGFKHFFKVINKNELTEKTLKQLQGYEKLFNKSALILSFLDVITTLIICLTIGLLLSEKATILAVMLRGTIMAVRAGNNAIQLGKLYRSMRAIALVSGVYALARGKRYMKEGNFMWTKIKDFFKYIFKTNPITIFLGIGSIAVLIVNGATGNVIAETLLGWLNDPTAITATFYTVIGGLGVSGAIFGGAESNATADARKVAEKEAAVEKKANRIKLKEDAKFAKLAEEKLAIEKKAKEEAEVKNEAARKATIMAQLKAEAQNKTNEVK